MTFMPPKALSRGKPNTAEDPPCFNVKNLTRSISRLFHEMHDDAARLFHARPVVSYPRFFADRARIAAKQNESISNGVQPFVRFDCHSSSAGRIPLFGREEEHRSQLPRIVILCFFPADHSKRSVCVSGFWFCQESFGTLPRFAIVQPYQSLARGGRQPRNGRDLEGLHFFVEHRREMPRETLATRARSCWIVQHETRISRVMSNRASGLTSLRTPSNEGNLCTFLRQ